MRRAWEGRDGGQRDGTSVHSQFELTYCIAMSTTQSDGPPPGTREAEGPEGGTREGREACTAVTQPSIRYTKGLLVLANRDPQVVRKAFLHL